MSDALKPQLHGRDHRPGGRDPIPGLGTIRLFHANSTTDLSAAYTTLSFTDDSYATEDGTYISVNGSGNVQISGEGAYLIQLYSKGWSLPAGQGSQVDYDVRVISGTDGYWSRENSDPQVGATVLLRIEESTGSSEASNSGNPDLSAMALWQSSATFPAVIRFQAQFSVDGVATATTNPSFLVAVTRMGSAFE